MDAADLSRFPGGDLIRQGLDHLAQGLRSEAALLVLIGAPRLRRLGFDVRDLADGPPEHKLYELLSASDPDTAHSRYNALIRRLVSFERAVECAG
jgi:hypothetical protein